MPLRDEVLDLLRRDPALREEVRRQLLTEDLLGLPAVVRELTGTVAQLAAAQERTEGRLAQLAAAQERTEERLAQLAAAQERTEGRLAQLAAAQERTEERLAELATAQERTEDRLAQLATAQERTEERLAQLATAQERTEERLAQLATAQERTEERLAQLATAQERMEERLADLTVAQGQTRDRLADLIARADPVIEWQRGEDGRRRGERFEREVGRRGFDLFGGGRGGSLADSAVVGQLLQYLETRPRPAGPLSPEEDPFLADVIWWKGEDVLVVEASLRVNGTDVTRAAARAAVLAGMGVRAIAVVVGDQWATADTPRQAAALRVEWKVGDDLSPGLLELRRRAA